MRASYSRVSERLTIKIIDTGMGIAKKDQAKLFQAFGKLNDDVNKRLNTGGIGLGLTICQALVTQNGGQIKVYSEGPGKGTTFEFYFTLKQCEQDIHDLTYRNQVGTDYEVILNDGAASDKDLMTHSSFGESSSHPSEMISNDLDVSRLDQNINLINEMQGSCPLKLELNAICNQGPYAPIISRMDNDTPCTLTDHISFDGRRSQMTFRDQQQNTIRNNNYDMFYLSHTQPCEIRLPETSRA